jgi:hypothetical protein
MFSIITVASSTRDADGERQAAERHHVDGLAQGRKRDDRPAAASVGAEAVAAVPVGAEAIAAVAAPVPPMGGGFGAS